MAGINFNSQLIAQIAGRISYLNTKQDLYAQNVANLETPGYQAKDIEFKGYLEQFQGKEALNKTVYTPDIEVKTKSSDPKVNGNTVHLEEQMAKLTDNSVEFMMATEILKKHLALTKLSVQSG